MTKVKLIHVPTLYMYEGHLTNYLVFLAQIFFIENDFYK